MIKIAHDKAIYDSLFEDDIVAHLAKSDERFDLVIATDVFIYVGELRTLFAEVKRCTTAGSCFLFSTERSDNGEYLLCPSGRYAHSPVYIEALAAEFGFTIAHHRQAKIRMEAGVPLPGDIFALRRNGD